jgi:hypothetical protein
LIFTRKTASLGGRQFWQKFFGKVLRLPVSCFFVFVARLAGLIVF